MLPVEIAGQILLATAIGALVGLEREWSGKAAGLRTQLLVCVGSAIFTILSAEAAVGSEFADPARISAQIVSGLGFLGGAVVLKAKGDVRGVTTAATIWTVASLGVAVGMGQYVIAVLGAAIVLVTLGLLGRLDAPLAWQSRPLAVEITLADEEGMEALPARIAELGYDASITHTTRDSGGRWQVKVTLKGVSADLPTVSGALARLPLVEGLRVQG